MKSDIIKPDDTILVTVIAPNTDVLYKWQGTGMRTLQEAAQTALTEGGLIGSDKVDVVNVYNVTRDVEHSYRFNAHGALTLIV